MSVIAIIRPDSWNFPLLVHVLGASLLVGALVLAGAALLIAWRDGNASLVRAGYRSLLLGALPSWIVMRGGAQWIASKEHVENSNAAWVGIGFSIADGGVVLLVIVTVLAARAAKRDRVGGFGRASAALVGLLLVAYIVALWAMTTKPV